MNQKNRHQNKEVFRFKRFARKSYSVFNSIRRTITIGVLSGCTLLSAHASSVSPAEKADNPLVSDSIPEKELSEIVVTGSKTSLPLNLSAKMVTVITAKEIERAPVKSVEDLLNYFPGADVLQRGPHGVQADISLRGGSFDQTAILLNGINLTNPQTGHYSFDIPLNLSDIERIEIVQGPSSLTFGASAFSGGINIITKKENQSNLYAKLEGGMHGLYGAEARGAYKSGAAVHRFSAGYKHSGGYIANSDYDILNLLWQSGFGLENANIDFTAGYNDKNYGANTFYSPKYPNQYDDTESMFLSVKGETFGKLKFIPQLYWNRHFDVFQLIREGTPDVPAWYTDHNYHRSDVFGINLNMQYASGLGITSFGGEFRNESVLSSVLGKALPEAIGKYTKADSRTNIGYFAEHNFIFRNLTLSLGGLLNHNTAVTNRFEFYPAINTSYRFGDNFSLYASWSKATRMPTFTDLYYRDPNHVGNSALLPEQTQSAEGGLKFRNNSFQANATLFHTRGSNLIDWLYDENDKKWHSYNLGAGKVLATSGVSADFSTNLQQVFAGKHPFRTFQIGYQYLHQNNKDSSGNNPISQYVFNYLKHKFTASLHHEAIKNLTFTWSFRWQDRAGSYMQYTDLKEERRVDYKPFSILDIKADYRFGKGNIFVNANNLFNTTHTDFGNIPQPGFWLSGGVNLRLE